MQPPPPLLAASDWLYRILLAAYPAAFRREYGAAMAQMFRDCCRDSYQRRGSAGLARLWLRTLGDLATTALKERAANAAQRGRTLVSEEERSIDMPLFIRPQRVYRSLTAHYR